MTPEAALSTPAWLDRAIPPELGVAVALVKLIERRFHRFLDILLLLIAVRPIRAGATG